jgi:hypothetical protein
MLASNAIRPRRSSSQPLSFTSARLRRPSRRPSAASAPIAINVRATKVSALRLASTRSNTWSMYSGAVSINRFTNALNAASATNAPRHARMVSARTGALSRLASANLRHPGRPDASGTAAQGDVSEPQSRRAGQRAIASNLWREWVGQRRRREWDQAVNQATGPIDRRGCPCTAVERMRAIRTVN